MSFHEIQFPTDISYDSKRGPMFSTAIIKLRSGAEERTARWSYPLHTYDVAYGLRSHTRIVALQSFFICRLGPATGFRYRDPMDFTTEESPTLPDDYRNGSTPLFTDVIIGTGDGSTQAFQLVKKYSDTVVTRTRTITKPIEDTVVSGINGVEKTLGVDFTVDDTTGILTYGTPPGNGLAVTAGFEFDVPVRFAASLDDGLISALTSYGGSNLPSIPVEEMLVPGILAEEFPYGGSQFTSFSVQLDITPGQGRVQVLNPAGGGLVVRLPDTTYLPDGGPYFYVVNASATNAITFKNYAGITQFTLAASASATVVLATVSGTRTWYGF